MPRVASRKGVKGPTVSFECDGPATSAGWIRLPPRRRPERARDSDPDEALQHARLGRCVGDLQLRRPCGPAAGATRRDWGEDLQLIAIAPAGWGEDLQLIAIDRSSDSSARQDQPGRKHKSRLGTSAGASREACSPKPAVPDEGEATLGAGHRVASNGAVH